MATIVPVWVLLAGCARAGVGAEGVTPSVAPSRRCDISRGYALPPGTYDVRAVFPAAYQDTAEGQIGMPLLDLNGKGVLTAKQRAFIEEGANTRTIVRCLRHAFSGTNAPSTA